jgi:hypothetical protein
MKGWHCGLLRFAGNVVPAGDDRGKPHQRRAARAAARRRLEGG